MPLTKTPMKPSTGSAGNGRELKLPPLSVIDAIDKWVHAQTRFHLPDTDEYKEMLDAIATAIESAEKRSWGVGFRHCVKVFVLRWNSWKRRDFRSMMVEITQFQKDHPDIESELEASETPINNKEISNGKR